MNKLLLFYLLLLGNSCALSPLLATTKVAHQLIKKHLIVQRKKQNKKRRVKKKKHVAKRPVQAKKFIDLLRQQKVQLRPVSESQKNIYAKNIAQTAPYNALSDFDSFIKKLHMSDGFAIQNTTPLAVPLNVTYESNENGSLEHTLITVSPHGYYIFDKKDTAVLHSIKIIDPYSAFFLNPKFTEDSFLNILIEPTQDRHFLHQYHPFTFASQKFTDEQLNDPTISQEERAFRHDFNGSCDYLNYAAHQEGLSLAAVDQQRMILYARNNIGALIKDDPKLLDSTVYRIPLVTHKIWVTSDSKPVSPSPQYIKWLENSIEHNLPSDGWKHYFWIESKEKLPELAQLLENHPTITLRELKELDSTQFITGNLYLTAIEEKKFGKATDILRLELLRLYGGYYLDTDYELFQSLLSYSKAYDMVVGLEPMSTYLCNAFIGACPQHPVIIKALEMIKRNLSENAPDYIRSAPQNGFKTIVETGPVLFTLAFALAGGKDTQDIVMPPQIIYPAQANEYPKKQVVVPQGKIPAEAIGAHYWNTAWMDPKFGSKG